MCKFKGSNNNKNTNFSTDVSNSYNSANIYNSPYNTDMDIETETLSSEDLSPINPQPDIPNPYMESEVFKVLLSEFNSAHLKFDEYMSNRNFINRILKKLPKPRPRRYMKIGKLLYKIDNSIIYQRAKNKLRP